jgi:hypothetical protein
MKHTSLIRQHVRHPQEGQRASPKYDLVRNRRWRRWPAQRAPRTLPAMAKRQAPMIHVPAEPAAAATAAAPPAHAVAPAFEQRLEEARQAGPSMWIHEQLLALRDLARAAGVEQWEMIFALTTHAIALARRTRPHGPRWLNCWCAMRSSLTPMPLPMSWPAGAGRCEQL